MSETLPEHLPACAVNLLARQEWFYPDPNIVSQVQIAKPNLVARLLTDPRLTHYPEMFAITMGETIRICQKRPYDPHNRSDLALLAHEIKHAQQYKRVGKLRFAIKYLWEYATKGYSQVSFEKEASALQSAVEAHLNVESLSNSGIPSCDETGGAHAPNPAYVKMTPRVFQFPPE